MEFEVGCEDIVADGFLIHTDRGEQLFEAVKVKLKYRLSDGCVLTDEFTAAHIRAENVAERNQMRGSKYIQSKLGDTFKNVRKDLGARKEVLFSGTSCQVAGLKHFLGKEYKNLFCVDIVCNLS